MDNRIKRDEIETAAIRRVVDSLIHKLTYPEMRTRLLNKSQVAEYMGISMSTFNRMLEANQFIEPIQVTKGRLQWDLRKVDEFIDRLSQ